MVKTNTPNTRRAMSVVDQKLARKYHVDPNRRALSASEFRTAIVRFDTALPVVTDKIATDVSADAIAGLAMSLMFKLDQSGLSGKTLGIVGFGHVGQRFARRAHVEFGMDVVIFTRCAVDPWVLSRCGARQVASLDALLPQCDFVSLHCTGGAANTHLINSARLDLMKPDAFLINTARREIVNETALAQALMFETIGGAAIDLGDTAPPINPMLAQCDHLMA